MQILVIGDEENLNECRQKFGDRFTYLHEVNRIAAGRFFGSCDVAFDFLVNKVGMELYRDPLSVPLFINVPKITLMSLDRDFHFAADLKRFGFAGLPSFLNREILEVSMARPEDREMLTSICQRLGTSFQTVEDRVGMVTPRVICMIINEAFYTLEDGIATRGDIDLAMKLGTNYPYGPFEWCKKIGARHVCELLNAVFDDTRNERYRICLGLEREMLT